MIVKEIFKCIYDNVTEKLYDLSLDPYEQTNLFSNSYQGGKFRLTAQELYNQPEDWAFKQNGPFFIPKRKKSAVCLCRSMETGCLCLPIGLLYGCHQHLTPHYRMDSPRQIRTDTWFPEHETDIAIDYMKKHKGNRPFALFVSWNPPHSPMTWCPKNTWIYTEQKKSL